MTLPEYLAGWAVACFMVALILLAMRSHWRASMRMAEACGRVLAPTAGDGQDPRRTPQGADSPGPSPAGVTDWAAEGWVA